MAGRRHEDPHDRSSWQLLSLSGLGVTMVVCIVAGLAAGLFLDRRFSSSPLFTIGFFLLGIAAGFWQMIKEIRNLNRP